MNPADYTRTTAWIAWWSLAAFTALWVARWPAFPLVLDPYYHVFVAQQVVAAGGPIAYEWWEYAPVGRPHLYPPILHLLLAALLKLGGSPAGVIRFASAALLPALLVSVWLVMRRLFSSAAALACLALAMMPWSFHLRSASTMAATLGMIELLWLLDALEHGRWLSAGLLLALLCYTHLGLPWIAVVTIACAALLRPRIRPSLAKAAWGLGLGIPWFWHLLANRHLLHAVARHENILVEFSPVLSAAALIGLWRCWRSGGRWLWLPACWLGVALLIPHHRYRWLCGEGLLPVILLAGVGLEAAVRWLADGLGRALSVVQQPEGRRISILVGAVALAGFVCAPTLAHSDAGWRWVWPDAAPWHLLGSGWAEPKETEASLDVPPVSHVAEQVLKESRPAEILWSNAPYALGLVAALARRPISNAMFPEVAPNRPFDPIRAAHLIVWFRFEPLKGDVTLAHLSRYRLTRVGEDEVAVIFRQADVTQQARHPEAVLPLWASLGLLAAALAGIVWDDARSPGLQVA